MYFYDCRSLTGELKYKHRNICNNTKIAIREHTGKFRWWRCHGLIKKENITPYVIIKRAFKLNTLNVWP